jgi:hypothetical protein
MSHIGVPSQLPHIAIYRSTNAKFNEVDLIVVCWSKHGEKLTYGYQLKEGNKYPKKNKTISFQFDKCLWIRGKPPQEAAKSSRKPRVTAKSSSGWLVADDHMLQEFFGKSGCHWTPNAWGELKDDNLTLIIK